MKKVKELLIDIIIVTLFISVVTWLLISIRNDQADFLENCLDKGYSYDYCMLKLRP